MVSFAGIVVSTGVEASGRRTLLDIINELGMLSFFQEARRIVVVNNLLDLCAGQGKSGASKVAGKKAKAKSTGRLTPMQIILRFFERDFESTNNAIIFCLLESFEKRRTFSASSFP